MLSPSNPPIPLDVPSSSSSSSSSPSPSRCFSIFFVLLSVLTLILEIVSFTQPWWPDGLTPFALKIGDRYVPVSGCSINTDIDIYNGGYQYYYRLSEQAECSSYNAVKAFILLSFFAGVACTILIIICMLAPSCRLRLPLRALSICVAITMIISFIFNIIAMGVYVGNEERKLLQQRNCYGYYCSRDEFPWQPGFILLLVELLFQLILCIFLYHTVRSLMKLKQNLLTLPPQPQALYAQQSQQQQQPYQQPIAYQQPQYQPYPQPHFQPYQQPAYQQPAQYQPQYQQPPQPFVNPAPAPVSAPIPAPPSADAGVFVPIPGSNAYVYYPPGQSPAGAQQHVQAIQTQMQSNAPTPTPTPM